MMDRIHVHALIIVIAVSYSVDACFPGNTWINCLLNTCTIYKTCPGDPTAKCTIKRTECGCEAKFYKPSGELAKCNVRKNLKLCPGGEVTVRCDVDICQWPCNHPDFLNAPCRQNTCGRCSAEYFVQEKWISCPSANQPSKANEPTGQMTAVMIDPNACANFVPCNIKVCIGEKCPLQPRAVCRPDGCNECKPSWYIDNVRVDCFLPGTIPEPTKVAMATVPESCPAGQVPCDISVCEKKICRNYPDAICSPNGCGNCQAKWTVGNTQVDCLSDGACPADVPFVKCVADPCDVFGHYCPHAECRATQCGKCDAKFYVNGEQIDCVMQPKTCAAGVKPLNCKWFTCPSNVCPSNKRLMCRIDPCGPTCKHDWVDIYNGEIMTCRVFDGDGRTIKQKSDKIFMTDPLSPFFKKHSIPKPSGVQTSKAITPFDSQTGILQTGSNAVAIGQTDPGLHTQSNVFVSKGPATFHVEPVFVQPRHIESGSDLYAMLNAFEHELMGISSLSIQNVLRKGNFRNVPLSLPTVPLDPSVNINMPLEPISVPLKRDKPISSKKANSAFLPKRPGKDQAIISQERLHADVPISKQLENIAPKPSVSIPPKKTAFSQAHVNTISKAIPSLQETAIGVVPGERVDIGLNKPALPLHQVETINQQMAPFSDQFASGSNIQMAESIKGVNIPSPFEMKLESSVPAVVMHPTGKLLPQKNVPNQGNDAILPNQIQDIISKDSLPTGISPAIGSAMNVPETAMPMDIGKPSFGSGDTIGSIGLPPMTEQSISLPFGSSPLGLMAAINDLPLGMMQSQDIASVISQISGSPIGRMLTQDIGNVQAGDTPIQSADITGTGPVINPAIAITHTQDASSNLPFETIQANDFTLGQVNKNPIGTIQDKGVDATIGTSNDLPFVLGGGMAPPKDFSFWHPDTVPNMPSDTFRQQKDVIQVIKPPMSNGVPDASASNKQSSTVIDTQKPSKPVEQSGLPINMAMFQQWPQQ